MNHLSYTAHGICLLWNWWLIAPLVMGNLIVAGAYLSIPFDYLRAYRKTVKFQTLSTSPFSRGFLIRFAAFIFFCGGGHLIDIATLWRNDLYWLQAYWTLFGTGLTSVIAAAYVSKRMRYLLPALNDPIDLAELHRENDELRVLVAAMRRQIERG